MQDKALLKALKKPDHLAKNFFTIFTPDEQGPALLKLIGLQGTGSEVEAGNAAHVIDTFAENPSQEFINLTMGNLPKLWDLVEASDNAITAGAISTLSTAFPSMNDEQKSKTLDSVFAYLGHLRLSPFLETATDFLDETYKNVGNQEVFGQAVQRNFKKLHDLFYDNDTVPEREAGYSNLMRGFVFLDADAQDEILTTLWKSLSSGLPAKEKVVASFSASLEDKALQPILVPALLRRFDKLYQVVIEDDNVYSTNAQKMAIKALSLIASVVPDRKEQVLTLLHDVQHDEQLQDPWIAETAKIYEEKLKSHTPGSGILTGLLVAAMAVSSLFTPKTADEKFPNHQARGVTLYSDVTPPASVTPPKMATSSVAQIFNQLKTK